MLWFGLYALPVPIYANEQLTPVVNLWDEICGVPWSADRC